MKSRGGPSQDSRAVGEQRSGSVPSPSPPLERGPGMFWESLPRWAVAEIRLGSLTLAVEGPPPAQPVWPWGQQPGVCG